MEGLIERINGLKDGEVSLVIEERMKEFDLVEDLFSELCFCLMTANFRAKKSIELQGKMGEMIRESSEEDLARFLKKEGHRFWPQRATRIVLAREFIDELDRVVREEDRDWIVENVHGLGMKEASHFLRNVGACDVAIIDFHIIDLLVREGLVERPKSLSKGRYLEIEEVLRELGKKVDLSLAELDLYLWYLETGKVLK